MENVICIDDLSDEELCFEIDKAIHDVEVGAVYPAEQVEKHFKDKYKL